MSPGQLISPSEVLHFCAQNSPDCGPTDVRRVFIEVSYDGRRQGPANVDGALRDPTI
jgi:hypothetical protein